MDEALQQNIKLDLEAQPLTLLSLGDNKQYEFKAQVDDMKMFDLRENRTKKQVRTAKTTLANTLKEQNAHIFDGQISYAERRATTTSIFKNKSSSLSLDSKWYGKDTPEMVRVKKTVNYMNNLLDASCEKYVKKVKESEYIDAEAMKDDLHVAFDEAYAACENYINEKARKKQGKWFAGGRRLNKVIELRNEIEKERLKYDALADAIQIGSLMQYNVETDKLKSPRELSARHFSIKAEIADWQNQGNSTDVYRIKVMEDGKEVWYYIKENLPLLSSDPEGFLDRRIAQLQKSKAEINTDKEELRMKKARMDGAEYDAAINFLQALKNRITNASEGEKQKVKQEIVKLFSHDFDKMFINHSLHNKAAELLENKDENGGNLDLEAIARDKNDPRCMMAKYVLESAKKGITDIKKMSALDWVKKELNLKDGDQDIINGLAGLQSLKDDKGVEDLFRVSMGKEVELFGQMRDRSNGKGEEREIAAANNTATFVLAKMCNFTDVLTESDMRIVRFKNRQDQWVESFCTVTKEAVGHEFIDVLKKAEKEGKKIDYTPKAVRTLMRLQAFDTLCLQVDRHGRNFKCNFVEKNGTILITDLLSYDHDMSFLEENLDEAFKDEKTGEERKKGFLPPMTTRLKKGSPEYRYVREKYFHIKESEVIKELQMPEYRPKVMTKINLSSNANEVLMNLPWRVDNELSIKSGDAIDQRGLLGNYSGKMYRIPQDPGPHASKEERDAYTAKKAKYDQYFKEMRGFEFIERREEIDSEFAMTEEEQKQASDELVDIITKLDPLINLKKNNPQDKEELDRRVAAYRQKNPKTKMSDETIAKSRISRYRTDLTKEQKQEAGKQIKRLMDFMKKTDIRQIYCKKFQLPGLLDLWAQNFIYGFLTKYKEDADVMGAFEEEYEGEEKEARDNALKELTDPETGDIVVPSLLHYDGKAYHDFLELQKKLNSGALESNLKQLNFKNKKIEKLKERVNQIVTNLKNAERKAKAFYKLQGLPEDTKFFLDTEEDYKKYKSIGDFAVDPGNTYLSIDNEHYLFGNEEFVKKTNLADREKALHEEVKKREDPKRWDHKEYASGVQEDALLKKFMQNPLRGDISSQD